jgi:hypothetical protein
MTGCPMHRLLLWNSAYFFGGTAQFFLATAFVIAIMALLSSWFLGVGMNW